MNQPWSGLRLAVRGGGGGSCREVRLAQRGSRWRTKMKQGRVDVWGWGSGQGEMPRETNRGQG